MRGVAGWGGNVLRELAKENGRKKIQSMRQLRNAFVIISTNDCRIFLISQFSIRNSQFYGPACFDFSVFRLEMK